MRNRWLALVLPVLVLGCGGPPDTPAGDAELDTLVAWMTGSFSSAEQADADSDFFDIRLEMVPIWKHRDDGAWLYVEQAVASALERPYRQRVYHVQRDDDGAFVSKVYAFEDPKPFIGAWRAPDKLFVDLEAEVLVLREGCAVYLQRQPDGTFSGSTRGQGCSSSLADAAYATSEVTVHEDRIVSWDRGFDAEGAQVWGAEKSGYVFLEVPQ